MTSKKQPAPAQGHASNEACTEHSNQGWRRLRYARADRSRLTAVPTSKIANTCRTADPRSQSTRGSDLQMRWKTSVPRTFRPATIALPLATTVVGLTKRPDQLVVTLQSDVQFRDVWKTTRGPRTLPTRL
jgi:hypothetical protein